MDCALVDSGLASLACLNELAAASSGESLWRTINDFLISLAQSSWALLAVYAISALDGFFPPVPAETLVVATAAVYSGLDWWWQAAVLWLVAALGAMTGDFIAYSLGRWLHAGDWRFFQRGKGRAVFAWAQRLFARGAAPLMMVARFIPGGRVAVNLTAGTVRYPVRRFLLIDATATSCWSAYSVVVGYVAGQAVGDNPLLGVICGIAFAICLGTLVQWLINRHYSGVASATGGEPPTNGDRTD
ncbi:MAG: DedA family protein [Bifidobacteriaceae bacterium]|jgi:membrane protein DedA with SNARE-associated domain|nr:DedA family protein [Bifidobacteriaceae bacterium]